MKFDIGLLRLAGSAASYAAHRQSLIAQNIANADTPGYQAKDLKPFGEIHARDASAASGLVATRPGHIGSVNGSVEAKAEAISAFGAENPNGNTVSLEDQMARAADVKLSHDMALSIYQTSLDILRLGLGRRG